MMNATVSRRSSAARAPAARLVLRVAATVVIALLAAMVGNASAIPAGWTCIGNCGTLGANGVVTAPPASATYDWVSTNSGGSVGALDLNLGVETNGSILRSMVFAANASDVLQFNFNYVTSDGAGYADYAWSRLMDDSLNPVALLFTARTTPGGNTVPGFSMPANSAALVPPNTPIIGGTTWSPLGGYSGGCWATGCGHTGWIQSTYTIPTAGHYILEFGVVNWSDTQYDSGLAMNGTTVAGVPIDQPVPEPASLVLLGTGLAAVLHRRRSRRG